MSDFRKGFFSIDGSTDPDRIFEGYTDGTTWNGWARVVFTKEQMEKWCKASPYNYRFLYESPIVSVVIYFEDDDEIINAFPLQIEDNSLVEGYQIESYCFVEMKKIGEDRYEPI
jgi:hypothetical protein